MRWTWEAGPNRQVSAMVPAASAGSTIVVSLISPGSRRSVACLDAGSGRLLWERHGGEFAAYRDELAIVTEPGLQYVDARSGQSEWVAPLDAEWRNAWVGLHVSAVGVLLGKPGKLRLLASKRGDTLWSYDEPLRQGEADARVSVASLGRVATLSYYRAGGRVVGVDLATGRKLWNYAADEDILVAPVSSDDRLIVRTPTRLAAVDTTTGKEAWGIGMSLPATGGVAVAVDGRSVYSATGDRLARVDVGSGRLVSEEALPGPVNGVGTPVLARVGQLLAVACRQGQGQRSHVRIVLLDADSLRAVQPIAPFGDFQYATIVFCDDQIFMVSEQGVTALAAVAIHPHAVAQPDV